jgi:carbonic anhydrase
VSVSDIDALAVIHYVVDSIKVEDIIITGHYGCGGVKASFSKEDHGALETWLSHLREIRAHHHDKLQSI